MVVVNDVVVSKDVVVVNLTTTGDDEVVQDNLDVVVVVVDVDGFLMTKGDVCKDDADHLDGVVVRLPACRCGIGCQGCGSMRSKMKVMR